MKDSEKCLGCNHLMCYKNQYDILFDYSKWLEDLICSVSNLRKGELYTYFICEVYLKREL